MSDFQAIADRVEIEALRGEFTDAVMMRDYDRVASLFTPDGALRMPNIPVELAGQDEIRAWGERVPDLVDFLVQNTHPGTIALDGDTASGRAYMSELGRAPRWPFGAELRHLPRPLPAHPGRLEIHRTRLRGQIRGHDTARGLGAPRRWPRPLTRPQVCGGRKHGDHRFTSFPGTWDRGPVRGGGRAGEKTGVGSRGGRESSWVQSVVDALDDLHRVGQAPARRFVRVGSVGLEGCLDGRLIEQEVPVPDGRCVTIVEVESGLYH
jgi:SnoaL-like domain